MSPTLIHVLLWVSMWMVQIDNYTEQTPKCTKELNMISVIIGAVLVLPVYIVIIHKAITQDNHMLRWAYGTIYVLLSLIP